MDPYEEALARFGDALKRATDSGRRNMNAMTLATVNASGRPSTRTVLLKGFDAKGLRFFTDSRSRKGRDLGEAPHASACFYWEPIEVQARVDGEVTALDAATVAEDFEARPRAGQLMIWACEQSQPLADSATLTAKVEAASATYPEAVPTPPFWQGYCLVPNYIELWFGSRDRMHERVAYAAAPDGWRKTLLQP